MNAACRRALGAHALRAYRQNAEIRNLYTARGARDRIKHNDSPGFDIKRKGEMRQNGRIIRGYGLNIGGRARQGNCALGEGVLHLEMSLLG